MMKRALLLIAAVALLSPADAHAQRRVTFKSNPFSFAPYAGAWKDSQDISEDGKDTGYLIGFRTGYDIGRRTRLIGDIAYGQTDNVGNTPAGTLNYNKYDNNWVMTTGGLEYDIIPGPTSVTFGAQAGAAWRKVTLSERVGFPEVTDASSGFTANLILVPRVSVRHSFTPRTALDVSVLDQVFPDDRVEHSPALTIGFMFR